MGCEAAGRRPFLALALGFLVAGTTSAAERTSRWVEVRAPHFTVYSDGSAKQARQVAWQFEDIRELFHRLWPWARLDPSRPIVILAVKDESGLKALLPEYWERKGGFRPAGLFVTGEDKHYIALRTDLADEYESWEENPYHLAYHEYVHLIVDLNFGRLPAWVNEGLAEFYGATIIGRNEIRQGKPLRSSIYLLRERTQMPIEALLQVDYNSREYDEQDRASVFYAQSWALVHYFLLGDEGAHRQSFANYLSLLKGEGADEQAARPALGDLAKLGRQLESYVRRFAFTYLRIKLAGEAGRAEMPTRDLAEAESLAVRGDFHLARGRFQAARPLLEQAVERAPDLAAAHASLGLLDLREEKRDEARRRVARAVELDSKSFLIHYLDAILNMGPLETRESLAPVEQSLERSVTLNHDFAPAYALLAEVSGYRSGNYAGAVPLARRAVALEPGVVQHRLSVGRLLSAMGKLDEASREGNRALAGARSESDRQAAQQFLATLVRPTPPPVSTTPGPTGIVRAPGEAAESAPVRVADGVGAGVVTTRGVIVSMICRPSGELIFVVETAAGRLTLRADAPDRVFLRKAGAWVQMDWTCGALRIPVTVRYRANGNLVSFGLDAAP